MPDFEELNKIDWFTPVFVEKTPKFDQDQYGNTWYTVVFEGDAGQYLWLAKNDPIEKKKYYGHLELTKSGKATRFRTDKEPEGESAPVEAASKVETVDKQDSIYRSVALNNAAIVYQGTKHSDSGDITMLADIFLSWLKDERLPEETDWIDKAKEELDDE